MKIVNPSDQLDLVLAYITLYHKDAIVASVQFDDAAQRQFVIQKLEKLNLKWADDNQEMHTIHDGIMLVELSEDELTNFMQEFDESQHDCPYVLVAKGGEWIGENS